MKSSLESTRLVCFILPHPSQECLAQRPSSDTRACTVTLCLTHTRIQAFCRTLSIHSSSQIPCLTEDHAGFFRNHSLCHSAWSSGCKQQAEAGPPASFLLSMPPSSHSKHACFITSRLSPSSKKEKKEGKSMAHARGS